jgi:hypothetical protein
MQPVPQPAPQVLDRARKLREPIDRQVRVSEETSGLEAHFTVDRSIVSGHLWA